MPKKTKFDKYLRNRLHYLPFIATKPSSDLKVVVTIPVFKEPDLLATLKSIYKTSVQHEAFEVLVIVNHGESASPDAKALNQQTARITKEWASEKGINNLHVLCLFDVNDKVSGVGHARKTVMDEALQRLLSIGRSEGLIVCTDGDTIVDENYLEKLLLLQSDRTTHGKGVSFGFEHRLEGVPGWQREAIIKYELHLRYFKRCHDVMGHPHGFYTVGSAMAARASEYVRQGGMNERKAGEDFYFLQKYAKARTLLWHPEVVVFPSARPSDRVPFGTGKAIMDYEESGVFQTYSFQDVLKLKGLFERTDKLFHGELSFLDGLDETLLDYLESVSLIETLAKLRSQANEYDDFVNLFFVWFDAFKVMKSLHWLRDRGGQSMDLLEAVNAMRSFQGRPIFPSEEEALRMLRQEDRG